jgi:hypothetical protein
VTPTSTISITPASKWWEHSKKGGQDMTYTKPELAVLGSAGHVIENMVPPKPGASVDPGHSQLITPAYDLDE